MSIAEPDVSRRISGGSRSSLTRRRSLVQTPGLATRPSPTEGRRRTWNSWKPQTNTAPEEEWRWNQANRRMLLETVEDSQHTPTARAQTPSEMDYSQLGSLKLGSLAIVNTIPSPASSKMMLSQRPRMAVDEDYFHPAADEYSSHLTMENTRRRGHVKSKSAVLPAELDGTNFRETSHTATSYAEGYQAELLHSPFATAHTFGSANALASTIFDAPTTAIDTSGSSLFAATSPETLTVPASQNASHQRTSRLSQRPTPRTSDSGYSSNGSLRTGSRSRQNDVPNTSSKHLGGKRYYQQSTELSCLSTPANSEKTSELVIPSNSISSTASKSPIDGTSSTQRRLQRRRKSQPELPAVQSCLSAAETIIPEIPNSVKARFNRRLSHQPGMDALSQTYPSKDHITVETTSRDYTTANTSELAQHPSSEDDQTPATEVREVIQLTEIEPNRPPTPPPQSRRRSRSLFRRKSTVDNAEANKDFAVNGSVDLGTIASSIGSSPYDAAMSRPLRNTTTSPTHPHQLGATLPRAKSMVNMDSEAAAEFARLRSKDRALIEQDQQPHQRRRSFHNLKMDAGEAKASKRRPKSFLHDAPPVPTIDSSKLGVHLQGTVPATRRHDANQYILPLPARARPESDITHTANASFGARSHTNERAALLSARSRLESEMNDMENSSFSTSSHGKRARASQIVGRYDQPQAVNWEAYSEHWSQRRKSMGEGLRSHAGFGEASASTVNSRTMPQPRQHLVDRYSGGLQYGYEGGGNFHGSAGTRQLHSTASTKSLQWKHQYGVDLSDVPIMLQRAV